MQLNTLRLGGSGGRTVTSGLLTRAGKVLRRILVVTESEWNNIYGDVEGRYICAIGVN